MNLTEKISVIASTRLTLTTIHIKQKSQNVNKFENTFKFFFLLIEPQRRPKSCVLGLLDVHAQ